MNEKLQNIRKTLEAGEAEKARKMLRWVLKNEPSPDAWLLAAHMTEDGDQKIALVRRGLAMDEQHTGANRMLLQLEGAKPKEITSTDKVEWERKAGEKPVDEIRRQRRPDRFQRNAERQRFWSRLGCVSSIIFSISFSIAMYRAIGLMSPLLTSKMAGILGRPTPVAEIEGTPLADVDYAQFVMTPSLQEKALQQDMEILDDGYMHEHYFEARSGEEYAIYVQFLSVSAANVPRNVVLLDPTGNNATKSCMSGNILEGGSNVTLTCLITQSGTWKVLVVGRDGESVGAYFIGVKALNDDM